MSGRAAARADAEDGEGAGGDGGEITAEPLPVSDPGSADTAGAADSDDDVALAATLGAESAGAEEAATRRCVVASLKVVTKGAYASKDLFHCPMPGCSFSTGDGLRRDSIAAHFAAKVLAQGAQRGSGGRDGQHGEPAR